jgi:hypothetical protein
MKEKKLNKYCTRCGKQLVTCIVSDSFDPYTGKEKLAIFFKCPTVLSFGYVGNGKTISEAYSHDIIFINIK